MARPPRIEFPGAFYHVLERGNQRQEIFLDDKDRGAFLERVQRYKKDTGFILYAYVLMPNHVHLLIETANVPLSKIMQLINLTYTQYFNRKYNEVGHVFQGRYKALLCDRDEYLLSLVRYIHLNPVRAGLVNKPSQYKWSSHSEYLGGGKGIVDTEMVLRFFSDRSISALRKYEEFIHEAIGEGKNESFYKATIGQILGDDQFLGEVEKRLNWRDKPLRRPSFEEILQFVQEVTGVSEEEIVSSGRREEVVFARGILVGVWREFGYRLMDLQPKLRRDVSVLSRLSKISDCPEGRVIKNQVCRKLNA